MPKSKPVNRHTGGLESFGVSVRLYCIVNRHTGGLEIYCIKGRRNDRVNRHTGGLERFEDARLRKWIPQIKGKEVLQGVGSVKRDAGIWEDFLRDLGVPFEMVAPKNNITKLSADSFRKITGWQSKTNEHSRDAAMLVFGS